MARWVLAVVVLVAGCGGGSQQAAPAQPVAKPGGTDPAPGTADDCQRFVDKSRPTLEQMAKDHGKTLEASDFDTMVADCRTREPAVHGTTGKDQAVLDCVLAAPDDATVADCWSKAMQDYRAEPKGP